MAGHQTIGKALHTALRDRLSMDGVVKPLGMDTRIGGKTCLVTGASSGLGKAVAIELAQRGGRMILACRPGHSGLVEEIKKASGSKQVEMLEVDLSDLGSVSSLCDALRDRGERIQIAVLNAGLMPRTARKSEQGFELMFAVHFLANRLLVERMLESGILGGIEDGADRARLVFVSSESHRSAQPINFEIFGQFTPYGIRDGMKYYGLSKLHLTTYFAALARRLEAEDSRGIAVHALCPGPVASGIAREAPGFLKPLVSSIMKLFFLPPQKAAAPVIYLCCASDAGARSGIYLHMLREKDISPLASDEINGTKLIELSDAILARYMIPGEAPNKERENA